MRNIYNLDSSMISALMRRFTVFNIVCLGCLPLITLAAPLPDAGSIRQQIEQNQQQNIPHKTILEKPAEPVAMPAKTGIITTVKTFRFAGNTLLTAAQLTPAVKKYLNRPLDFAQLQAAAIAVANAYREAGWIVRAYLPEQDIIDGIVTIQIVEAVFGGAHINGEVPPRISRNQIMRIFEAQQKVGEPLNADRLDRALLLADDLPGVTVEGILSEGSKGNETDVNLKLGNEPLALGEVWLDNTGARSTGSNRVTANLNLNSPFKYGDLVTANVIHTQGSDYLRLDGNVPIGSDGWRTGINASALNYKLVAPEFVSLDANGTSDTVGVEATYPIIRSRLKNLYLNVNADNKTFNNLSSGAVTTNYKADTLTLGIEGNLFDNLWGGGANSASLSLVDGNLNLNGSPNQAADAITTQTAGQYSKLRYSASRQQVITETVSLFGSLSGQQASKNLDSSEKIYLGGATGVRAYPANEGGGSEGELANLELRWKLPLSFNFAAFYDYGRIIINKDNGFAGAAALNDYSLKGAGLSLAWQSGNVTLKASYSRRIGDNPNPTATGTDQDGSFVRDRLWLWATIPFSGGGSNSESSTASSSSNETNNSQTNVASIESPPTDTVAEVTAQAQPPLSQALANVNAENIPNKSVYFNFKSFAVLPEYQNELIQLAGFLKNHKNEVVVLEGNTDERGSHKYNLVLADKRARVVQMNLELMGTLASQIKVLSLGKTRPRLTCHQEQCFHENRRVDFVLKPNSKEQP